MVSNYRPVDLLNFFHKVIYFIYLLFNISLFLLSMVSVRIISIRPILSLTLTLFYSRLVLEDKLIGFISIYVMLLT
jgi:hypothetical protein